MWRAGRRSRRIIHPTLFVGADPNSTAHVAPSASTISSTLVTEYASKTSPFEIALIATVRFVAYARVVEVRSPLLRQTSTQ